MRKTQQRLQGCLDRIKNSWYLGLELCFVPETMLILSLVGRYEVCLPLRLGAH